jgi:predicted flap endonuclease-1-like 5' DNA nuclease
MIYLISQLWVWLLLTLVFAAVAGWAFAAERAAPGQRAQKRERESLMSDLLRLAAEDTASGGGPENEREVDAVRRLLDVRNGRIAELERALEQARSRSDDLAGELAERQRRGPDDVDQNAELNRLRALVADYEAEAARTIDVEPTPLIDAAPAPAEDEIALQGWRLRYFEQRVRYLETQARSAPVAPPPAADHPQPVEAWRAREAEARASYLEQALRDASAPQVAELPTQDDAAPFAANADVDVLLRWRLLYLERRVAHLQQAAEVEPEPPQAVAAPVAIADAGPDPDRWKWRARYLEARVRHLEERAATQPEAPVAAPQRVAEPSAAEALTSPPPRTRRGVKPPVLSAPRNGAPDDFTLIDSVSQLQQGTLNALGVFHFDQIAAWTPDHVAWIDSYLRLQGRIDDEEWIEQAQALAEDGPAVARRVIEEDVG